MAGAQDTIFDTETGDGKNVVASNALIRAYPVNAYTYYMLGAANHLSRAR